MQSSLRAATKLSLGSARFYLHGKNRSTLQMKNARESPNPLCSRSEQAADLATNTPFKSKITPRPTQKSNVFRCGAKAKARTFRKSANPRFRQTALDGPHPVRDLFPLSLTQKKTWLSAYGNSSVLLTLTVELKTITFVFR